MRTRIALVAIIPIAFITVALLMLAATAPPARASIRPDHVPTGHRHAGARTVRTDRLTSFVRTGPTSTTTRTTASPDLDVALALLTGRATGHKEVTPVVPPPAAVPVDTVTPGQRAEWDRVAMCEEGGNWQSEGPRFSGGLGITRANWDIYGGLQYAPSAGEATPDQQIMVAQRIQSYPPDQDGCSSW
jgi:hypothetical protein